MIERKFIAQNIKEFEIRTYLFKELSRVGLSDVKLKRTPLGEKIVVSASRPGLIVGKGGSNISRLTRELKSKFKLENPQIEIEEILDSRGDVNITAEMIANSLERFGSARFKGVGHKALSTVMASGALGVEILISGKIPGMRAKTWRFYQGYLKKCGDISVSKVHKAQQIARLKSGVVGIQVTIMPGTIVLPDKIELLKEPITIVEETDEKINITTKKKTAKKSNKSKTKKTTKKTTTKKEKSSTDTKKKDIQKESTEESKKETTTKSTKKSVVKKKEVIIKNKKEDTQKESKQETKTEVLQEKTENHETNVKSNIETDITENKETKDIKSDVESDTKTETTENKETEKDNSKEE